MLLVYSADTHNKNDRGNAAPRRLGWSVIAYARNGYLMLLRSSPFSGFLLRSSKSARPAASVAPLHPEQILLVWMAFFGLVVFATAWLWRLGVWHMLVSADPTFLTVIIVLIFFGCTLWCGVRSYQLAQQQMMLGQVIHLLHSRPDALLKEFAGMGRVDRRRDWIHAYFQDLLAKGPQLWRENGQLTDLLAERAHGPHETVWWINGIQLKLGLLGKVIGFSVLALQIGSMESFDPGQSQIFLKNLTSGLGIALLTTMTGLAANILLGLQLTRLDRVADELVAEALAVAESDLGAAFDAGT